MSLGNIRLGAASSRQKVRIVDVKTVVDEQALLTEWNDLWSRSDVAVPTARAEHVANLLCHFAPGCQALALIVYQDGQAVAALPVLLDRVRGLSVGRLPWNEWAWGADLLLDPAAPDRAAALDALAESLLDLPCRLLSFDAAIIPSERWNGLVAAFRARGVDVWATHRYTVGVADLGNGSTCDASHVSRNFRRQLRRGARLGKALGVRLEIARPSCPDEGEALLRRALAVELKSWKADTGTAICSRPDIERYFVDQARLMAQEQLLEIVLLTSDEADVAFEYGWRAKRVYFSPKVGYDTRFSALSPGHQLRLRHVEALIRGRGVDRIDFTGPFDSAMGRWASGQYGVSRLIVSGGGFAADAGVLLARRMVPLASARYARRPPRRHRSRPGWHAWLRRRVSGTS